MKSLKIPSNDFKRRIKFNKVCSSMWIDFYIGVIKPLVPFGSGYANTLWNEGLDMDYIRMVKSSEVENKHKILYE